MSGLLRQPVRIHLNLWRSVCASICVLSCECLGFVAHLNALEWESGNGFRSAPLALPAAGKTGFTLLPANATGITFTNLLSAGRSLTNQILLNGSGVAAGDVDGDGWCDLYFCGLDGPNRLFRNLGNWKFEEVTEKAGLANERWGMGVAVGDYDNDGFADLFVGSYGIRRLYHNNGTVLLPMLPVKLAWRSKAGTPAQLSAITTKTAGSTYSFPHTLISI